MSVMQRIQDAWMAGSSPPREIRAGKAAYEAYAAELKEISLHCGFEGAPFSKLAFCGPGGSADVVPDETMPADDIRLVA